MSRKLLKFTSIVGSMTLLSRITGMVRDIVFASFLGSGALADAFFVAFRIPNFFRRIFGEGAFSVAFVPVYKEYQATGSPAATRSFVELMSGRLGLILFAVSLAGMAAAPVIVTVLAPGFVADPEKFQVTTQALRITFPYTFFICLVAMSAGVLNSHDRFAVPALTPVLLNLSLIAAVTLLAPVTPNVAIAAAVGVFIAGALQLAFQLPFLRREGMLRRPRLRVAGPAAKAGRDGVRRVFKLMVPAIFGTSVAQVNLLVNTILASLLVTGSVSWLYYSDRLMEFPLGVFGIALATAILPHLSEKHASGSRAEFSRTLDWALRWVCLIGLPAAVGLIVLAGPALATLFQYRAFTPHDVEMAARSLVAFAVGLPAYVAVKVLANGFFARQNTRTPVTIGAIAMGVNVVASLFFLFVLDLAHVGLALATTVAGVVNATWLLWLLRRDGTYRPGDGWWGFLARVAVASIVMGALLWWGAGALSGWLSAGLYERVARLSWWIGAGFGAYVLCILLSGIRLRNLIRS